MYVDLAGLARYKRDFDAWARGALLPKDAAAARVRTAKAGAVSFVPVQETPLDVSVDFLFSETPPASGDKSPGNPSTITGVSSVKVTRCGKNLFERIGDGTVTSNGLTLVRNADGTCTLSGTAAANTFFYINSSNLIQTKAGLTYTLSGCPSGGSASTYRLACAATKDGIAYYYVDYGSGTSASKPFDGRWQMYIYVVSGAVISTPIVFKPQFELGSTATSFEKYEGTDYILPFGNTYYGGTLDVATGVMTVTHYGYTFTGQETFTYRSFGTLGRWDCVSAAGEFHGTVDSTCTHYPFGTTAGCIGITGSGATMIYFVVESGGASPASFLAEQYAAGTPVIFVTKLPAAEQYTVTLTPTEILSLTQSSDYDPRVNTVYSDAQAVQVGYLKHPSAASADLRSALVSLGGGV